MSNVSSNLSVVVEKASSSGDLLALVGVCAALGVLIGATVVGNLFVMVAIVRDRNLNSPSNYLVFSLALADLLVALLVMPIGAVYEVSREWTLGAALCDLWTSCDVLCCTASILHLLAIAVDRYWAVTDLDYARNRCKGRLYAAILLVWAAAFAVSIAPLFGWKDPDFVTRVEVEKRCLVSQDLGYQVFATCSSFYAPLILILILYSRIFREARRRIRRRPGAASQAMLLVQRLDPSSDPVLHLGKRERKAEKRERKAAKTLAIITGAFVVCWLPFFVTALLLPLCSACEPELPVFSVFLWLGYTNSMLNPILYTIFSPDFRSAFKRLLCSISTTSRVP